MPEDTHVAAIVEDIDSCGLEDFDDLLVDFLRICWPSMRAQTQ
jgi:hypothetical protein